MKTTIKTLLVVMLCAVLPQSCDDILSEPSPPTSVATDRAVNTLVGIQAIRLDMYSSLIGGTYTTEYMLAPSSLADDVFHRPGANRDSGENENGVGNTVGSWGAAYEIINSANIIINAINEDAVPDDLLAQYRGEAYFFRAFVMHHMARVYGYDPGAVPTIGDGAGFNKSIVIRTAPVLEEADATFQPRDTIEEVYNQLESDLKQAISLLSQSSGEGPNYVTAAAAQALLARVYLYWRKWDLAAQTAEAAIQNTTARLTTAAEVPTMFISGQNIGDIFVLSIDAQTEFGNAVNDGLAPYTSTQWNAQVPTQDLMDMYSSNDARLAWFGECYDEANDIDIENCLASHPAIANGATDVELQKWNADKGNYIDDIPYFRIAELVLIKAEGQLKGAGGVGAAVATLDQLRTNRGLAAYSGAVTPEAVMQGILDGRRREFVAEGQRFFDLKRLGMNIKKAPGTVNPTSSPQYIPTADGPELPYSSFRMLENIPNGAVVLSEQAAARGDIPQDSVLVQNPGF